jgi:uncharacterized protein YjgD (DUF1641 family)
VEGEVNELPTSYFGLMKEMRDPEVRRGLAITMEMLKRISRQYPTVQLAAQTGYSGNGSHSG